MTQEDDPESIESNALVKRTSNGLITSKGRRSQISLTSDIIRAAAIARTSSQALVDERWMQEIWDWADEFELTEEQIPRNRRELIELEKLSIEMCSATTFKRLLLERAKIQESLTMEISRRKRLAEIGMYISPPRSIPSTRDLDIEIKHLEKLKATVNKMSYLPIEIIYLKKLREISFEGIESSNLIQDIRKLSNLTKLRIVNCNINKIFENICQIPHLVELEIIDQEAILNQIPENISNLNKLKILKIWHGMISTLPESITTLRNLGTLDIYNNKLTELPKNIGSLNNLNILKVRANKLTELPDSIGDLTKLIDLDVSLNRIREFPDSLFQLNNLTNFDISHNRLGKLPKNVNFYKGLSIDDRYQNPSQGDDDFQF